MWVGVGGEIGGEIGGMRGRGKGDGGGREKGWERREFSGYACTMNHHLYVHVFLMASHLLLLLAVELCTSG